MTDSREGGEVPLGVVEMEGWPKDPTLGPWEHPRTREEPEESVRAMCWGKALVSLSLGCAFAGTH